MQANAKTHDAIAKLVPGGGVDLAHLSDSELLASTRRLVGTTNQVFAALLIHLAEVEARGIHRTRACSSLYTYCIYELRFSEDAAARRASAAKLVKRFPLLIDAISNGELHLTGLLLLGPHLTDQNLIDVLGRARFRTKKELAKLVRELDPLPLVPDRIEPLCPQPTAPRNPSWQDFVSSLAPPVRELPAGERPRDWAKDASESFFTVDSSPSPTERQDLPSSNEPNRVTSTSMEPRALETSNGARPDPARASLPATAPQQYHGQFSTTEEHVQLVERARALVARQAPCQSLSDLHLQAMRLLVAALEKQRFAVSATPRKLDKSHAKLPPCEAASAPGAPAVDSVQSPPSNLERSPSNVEATHQRGRYVPASLRRAVFERDGGRCTFVDGAGERCRETHFLELHHLHPFAKGGAHSVDNLTLHCHAHNSLAAELDFGREHMARSSDPAMHEARSSQKLVG